MTIEEIKSVSIRQYLEESNHEVAYVRRGIYFYLSPYRNESNPSFAVNPKENLWYDYATREGGNLINLYQKMHPNLTNHQVLTNLQEFIVQKNLQFSMDYEGREIEKQEREQWIKDKKNDMEKEKESNTIIDGIYELSHPNLKNYIASRRVDFEIAKRYCKQVHYSVHGKSYYAVSFSNIEGGMEVRNKFSKRTIGQKSISIIKSAVEESRHCCIFEGFFNLLSYETIRKWNMNLGLCIEADCDYYVLNSIGNLKIVLPYLSKYCGIHIFLDNDPSGVQTTNKILSAFPTTSIDESHRYKGYNDINDVICGKPIQANK